MEIGSFRFDTADENENSEQSVLAVRPWYSLAVSQNKRTRAAVRVTDPPLPARDPGARNFNQNSIMHVTVSYNDEPSQSTGSNFRIYL